MIEWNGLLIFPNWPRSTLVAEFHSGVDDGGRQVNILGLFINSVCNLINVKLQMCFRLDCVHQDDLNIP